MHIEPTEGIPETVGKGSGGSIPPILLANIGAVQGAAAKPITTQHGDGQNRTGDKEDGRGLEAGPIDTPRNWNGNRRRNRGAVHKGGK